jgi:hypothetical protein
VDALVACEAELAPHEGLAHDVAGELRVVVDEVVEGRERAHAP